MLDELDFTKEAANQETFRIFLKDSGIDHEVTAPQVFPQASTKRVLTMVRIDISLLTSFFFIPVRARRRRQDGGINDDSNQFCFGGAAPVPVLVAYPSPGPVLVACSTAFVL